MTDSAADDAEILVVGGGPAGYAAAIELARREHRVVVVDRGAPAGDPAVLLTPRAVAAANALDLDLPGSCHVIDHIRLTAVDSTARRTALTPWPRTRRLRHPGVAIGRAAFVGMLRSRAHELGVATVSGCEAVAPIVERGFVRGAQVRDAQVREGANRVREVRASYMVVADGPNSQFGRLLGTFRRPTWPYAVAQAEEFASPRHDDGEIEITVGLTDRIGTPIAGYGWVFPTGTGTVSVGVKLMSTSPSFQVINPVHLLEHFVEHQRERWHLDDAVVHASIGGRVPMGGSVGPLAGPTYLIVGDAGGAANPLSGTGIETALETGALGGTVVADALTADGPGALQQYPRLVDLRYGAYYKVGRLAQRVLGHPAASRRIHRVVTSRRGLADGTVRIALGHLRGRPGRGPELAYRLARAASTFAPDA